MTIIKSTGTEASKTVGHKYGEDAGKVTDDSLAAASHGINLAYVRITDVEFATFVYMYSLIPTPHGLLANIYTIRSKSGHVP